MSRPWASVKSPGSATPSDWHAGHRFTFAPWRAAPSVVMPPDVGGLGALGGLDGAAAVGPEATIAGTAGGGFDAGFVTAATGVGAVTAAVAGAGLGGGDGGVAGLAGGLGVEAGIVGAGLAGLGGAAGVTGADRSSSQIAAQTPQVWTLLVEALQAWAPQFGQ